MGTNGGILSLIDFLDEDDQRLAALEYDLLERGLRLRWVGDGTGRMSWRDLYVFISHLPDDSAVARYLSGSSWSISNYLQAEIIDGLAAISWQLSGNKHLDKPAPYPRPGHLPPAPPTPSEPHRDTAQPAAVGQGDPFNADESGVFRGEVASILEINDWLQPAAS